MHFFIKIIAIIFAFLVLIEKSFLKFGIGDAYFIIVLVLLGILLVVGRNIKFNFYIIWFIVAAILSILFNEIPYFFKPVDRLFIFVIVLGLVGPLIRNTTLSLFRCELFLIINYLIIVFVIGSFFSILLRLPFSMGRGGYVGFFLHSNFLSPMAAISSLNLVNVGVVQKKKVYKYLIFFGAGISFLTCLIAGSRAALLGILGGFLFFIYKINQGSLSRFLKVLLVVSSLVILTFPLWESYTETILHKLNYSEQQGSALYTRENRWNSRITEFESSPIIGVGFASVDVSVDQRYNEVDGQIEPGSSWLALLSMTGFFGFFPIVILVFKYYIKIFKLNHNKKKIAYLGGILTFFVLHLFAEGYITAAGSALFLYFWLLMGVIEDEVKYIYYVS